MNKIYKFLTLAVLLSLATTARAYNLYFNGIYYDLNHSEHTATVTYKSYGYPNNKNAYSHYVSIPEAITVFFEEGRLVTDVEMLNMYSEYAELPEGVEAKTYTVTSIGWSAFCYCNGLTSITIPSSVTSIGDYAFYSCDGLTSITIPSSVTSIGNYAFGGSGLTSIAIPSSVTSIGNNAFMWCRGLTSITLPSSVTTIGDEAFNGCRGLTSITIPSSVTSIGNRAFSDCSGLTSITIPSSVTSIGEDAFYYCFGLTSIKVDEGNKVYDSREGCNAIIETVTNTLIRGCEFTIIPSSVTSIGDYAFEWCSGLTSITIPSSVTSIGSSAFRCCDGLTSITIPSGVTSIGDYAFFGCSNLFSVTIPVSVISIGISAFQMNREKGSYYDRYTNFNTLTGSYAWLYVNQQNWPGSSSLIKSIEVTPTTATLELYRFKDNVSVSFFSINGQECDPREGHVQITGLNPDREHGIHFKLIANDTEYEFQDHKVDYRNNTTNTTFSTDPLTLTTEQPKVISVGNVIVSAQSNLDDAEENVGFEWRRTDWTDDFASNTGEAYLFDGMMEGYIRNLYAEKLWKYRPYYEAGDGTRYYGDWVGIDPTNTSYFEPTVHTYASVVVDGSTAAVKGYVQRGTDDVTEQGFAYWKTEAGAKGREDARRISSIPDDATTVVARGKVMTATLTGLEAGTEYTYVAYVITDEGETFYGEEQTFRTDVATGIEETIAEPVQRAVPQGIYNLSGQRLTQPQKGLNIINGKKVLVK